MEPYILFCRIGWANYYRGDLDDLPQGAGNYDGVEFECYNFLKSNNLYYGFVQVNGNMNLERIGNNAHDGQIDDVLVIFFHKGLIVGWYRHATVYTALQIIPDNVTNRTNFPQHNLYNIVASEAHLIQANERNSYPINFFDGKRPGRQNIWYADEAPSARESAITIVETYDMNHAEELINEEFSDIENESNMAESPISAVKNAFRKIEKASTIDDIKNAYPHEPLFDNLISPEESFAKRGILNTIREHNELLGLYGKTVMESGDDFTTYFDILVVSQGNLNTIDDEGGFDL